MKTTLKIVSLLGICLTIIPSILVLNGKIEMQQHKNLMLAGVFVWFLTAPFWMKSKPLGEKEQAE